MAGRLDRHSSVTHSDVDQEKLISQVGELFCEGKTPAEIAELLGLSREKPYELLRRAAQRRRLRYVAPLDLQLTFAIERKYPSLKRARVVQTAVAGQVAFQSAFLLKDLIRERSQQVDGRSIHIGLAGGNLLRETVRCLAQIWRDPSEPSLGEVKCYFHALVGGFNDEDDPNDDPNTFFTHFNGEPAVNASFVNFPSPGMVTSEEAELLKRVGGIRQSYERAKLLDIVITSAGGHWHKGCSRLHSLYRRLGEFDALSDLDMKGCIGDLMWMPIADSQAVWPPAATRAMTLLELCDLPSFVSRGGSVVLVLGPCGSCGEPKDEVLKSVLGWKERHVTHLVVDSRTAALLVGNGHNYKTAVG